MTLCSREAGPLLTAAASEAVANLAREGTVARLRWQRETSLEQHGGWVLNVAAEGL